MRNPNPRIPVDAEHLEELLDDLFAAVAELAAPYERDPRLWDRGRPGKWTAGQHVAHVGITLGLMARLLEDAIERFKAGRLGAVPPQPWMQRLFVHFVIRKGWMPRGARTIPAAVPEPNPGRPASLETLRVQTGRYRSLAATIPKGRVDDIWVPTPFAPGMAWHYRYPEVVRIQSVHVRHHAALAREASASEGG